MPSMKMLEKFLNQPVNKVFAAIVIGILSTIFLIYGLYDTDWESAELNALSILLPLFWVIFVAGFILLALGKKGKNVTSEETDDKIVTSYTDIHKKLTPTWWALGAVWCIWIAYLVWSLSTEA